MRRPLHKILVHFYPQAYSYDWSKVLGLLSDIAKAWRFLVNTDAKVDKPRVYLDSEKRLMHIVFIDCYTAIPLCVDYARIMYTLLETIFNHVGGVEFDIEVR